MAGHRWWRLANTEKRPDGSSYALSLAELRFYTKSGAVSSNPENIIVSSIYSGSYAGANVLDGNPATLWHSHPTNDGGDYKNSWIGYRFDSDEFVNKVMLQRTSSSEEGGREWIDGWLQYSDDGLVWHDHKYLEFNLFDNAEKIFSIVLLSDININAYSKSAYLNIYTTDESGSFGGRITEGLASETKVPLVTDVALYDRMTHKLLQITRSNLDGSYTFKGLDANREYYVTALHPTRKYNAVIQDGLTSGLTT